jgi:hypothetical protein
MTFNYLLPFFGYGFVLLGSSGSPALLVLTLTVLFVWWVNRERARIDLEAEVRFEAGRVWIGENRLSFFPPLWGTEIRNLVYGAAFSTDPLEAIDPETFFLEHIGITCDGAGIQQPLSANRPHAILIGPTGSGKTELAKLIASKHGGELWVVDFSAGQGFVGYPNVRELLTPDDLSRVPLLRDTLHERSRRQANMNLLLVVEGLADALCVPELERLIGQVASNGRSNNTTLLATNQTLTAVPRNLWVNCFTRICLSADSVDRAMLGFEGANPKAFSGLLPAELSQGLTSTSFGFPVGIRHEKTASEHSEAANPFLVRAWPRLQ